MMVDKVKKNDFFFQSQYHLVQSALHLSLTKNHLYHHHPKKNMCQQPPCWPMTKYWWIYYLSTIIIIITNNFNFIDKKKWEIFSCFFRFFVTKNSRLVAENLATSAAAAAAKTKIWRITYEKQQQEIISDRFSPKKNERISFTKCYFFQ